MRVWKHHGSRSECSNKHKTGGTKKVRYSLKTYSNRGTHGGSLLILSVLLGLSKKSPTSRENHPVNDFF